MRCLGFLLAGIFGSGEKPTNYIFGHAMSLLPFIRKSGSCDGHCMESTIGLPLWHRIYRCFLSHNAVPSRSCIDVVLSGLAPLLTSSVILLLLWEVHEASLSSVTIARLANRALIADSLSYSLRGLEVHSR